MSVAGCGSAKNINQKNGKKGGNSEEKWGVTEVLSVDKDRNITE